MNECSCHINPPCDFCLSLDEEEADVYASGGLSALREFRHGREEKFFAEAERLAALLPHGAPQDRLKTIEEFKELIAQIKAQSAPCLKNS